MDEVRDVLADPRRLDGRRPRRADRGRPRRSSAPAPPTAARAGARAGRRATERAPARGTTRTRGRADAGPRSDGRRRHRCRAAVRPPAVRLLPPRRARARPVAPASARPRGRALAGGPGPRRGPRIGLGSAALVGEDGVQPTATRGPVGVASDPARVRGRRRRASDRRRRRPTGDRGGPPAGLRHDYLGDRHQRPRGACELLTPGSRARAAASTATRLLAHHRRPRSRSRSPPTPRPTRCPTPSTTRWPTAPAQRARDARSWSVRRRVPHRRRVLTRTSPRFWGRLVRWCRHAPCLEPT